MLNKKFLCVCLFAIDRTMVGRQKKLILKRMQKKTANETTQQAAILTKRETKVYLMIDKSNKTSER